MREGKLLEAREILLSTIEPKFNHVPQWIEEMISKIKDPESLSHELCKSKFEKKNN